MTGAIKNGSNSVSAIKGLTVIAVSLIFMVSLFGCTVVDSIFNKTSRLESLVESGKYEEALSYYKDNRGDISKADATTYFELALDQMYQEYLAGQYEAEVITSYVDDLEKVDSDSLNEYGKSILADIDKIEASRDSFEKAEEALEDEDYAKAINLYEQVVKDDPHYEEAQNKITECREAYKAIKIDAAEVYANKNDYINAISSLNDALAVVGNDNELEELIESYQTAFDDLTYENAASLANEGKYDEAIELLSDNRNYLSDTSKCDETIAGYMDIAAQELLSSYSFTDLIANSQYQEAFDAIESVQSKYPDSALIAETYEETSNAFVEYELAIIDSYIDVSDYVSAFDECKSALDILPNASDLVSKQNYVEERQPVTLMDYYNSDTADNWGNSYHLLSYPSYMYDLFGNDHAGEDGFYIYFGGGGQQTVAVDFYLNEQFNKLETVVLVCEEQLGDSKSFEMNIYGDDELICQKSITNKTAPDEIVDVDVSGVTWLTIEFVDFGGTVLSDRYVAVINPTLYYE